MPRRIKARFLRKGHHVMDVHGRFHEVTEVPVIFGRVVRIEKGPEWLDRLPLDTEVTIQEAEWTPEEQDEVFGDMLDL